MVKKLLHTRYRVQDLEKTVSFYKDVLEKFAKHAEAKGYPLSDGPHSTGSGKIAFIDAPEGYEIELIESARES